MSSDQGVLYALNTFNKDWALVTAGTIDHYNTMTISWGGMGTLWSKPVATVYVKPCRFTHEFMEANDYFTVSFFSEQYRGDLEILGTRSGRDGDKVALTSLTPKEFGDMVTFEEADQVLLCRKIYRQDIDLSAVPSWAASQHYRMEAPHTIYIGEVIRTAFKEK